MAYPLRSVARFGNLPLEMTWSCQKMRTYFTGRKLPRSSRLWVRTPTRSPWSSITSQVLSWSSWTCPERFRSCAFFSAMVRTTRRSIQFLAHMLASIPRLVMCRECPFWRLSCCSTWRPPTLLFVWRICSVPSIWRPVLTWTKQW